MILLKINVIQVNVYTPWYSNLLYQNGALVYSKYFTHLFMKLFYTFIYERWKPSNKWKVVWTTFRFIIPKPIPYELCKWLFSGAIVPTVLHFLSYFMKGNGLLISEYCDTNSTYQKLNNKSLQRKRLVKGT